MNSNWTQFRRVLAGLLAFSLFIGANVILAAPPEKDKITIAIEEVEQILSTENAKIQATKPLRVKDLKKDEAVNSSISDQGTFKREILEINSVISEAKGTSNNTVAGFAKKKKEVTAVQLSGSGARGDLQKTAAAKAAQQKALSESGAAIMANAMVLSTYAKKLLAIGAATQSTYKFGDQLTNLGKALSIMSTVLTDLGQFVVDSSKQGTEADKTFFSAVGSLNKATQQAIETEKLVGNSVEAYAAAHGKAGVLSGIAIAEKAMGRSSFDPDRNGMDGRGEAGGISDAGAAGSKAGSDGMAAECEGMGSIGVSDAGAAGSNAGAAGAAAEGAGMGGIGVSDAGAAGSDAGAAGAAAEGAGMGGIGASDAGAAGSDAGAAGAAAEGAGMGASDAGAAGSDAGAAGAAGEAGGFD